MIDHDYVVVPRYIVSKYTEKPIPDVCLMELQTLDYPYYTNITTQDIGEKLELKTFDVALPQDWVDDVVKYTGKSPVAHVVWSYDESLFGEPEPITREGSVILAIYNHIKKEVTG